MLLRSLTMFSKRYYSTTMHSPSSSSLSYIAMNQNHNLLKNNNNINNLNNNNSNNNNNNNTINNKKKKRNLIVQKFGGTSLGTSERMKKVINIIEKFKKTLNNNLIIVPSAISSDNKSEGTTSQLLKAAQSAVNKNNDYILYLNKIEDMHFDIIYTLLTNIKLRTEIKELISMELLEIREFCKSLSVIRELSDRSHDKIIGAGERMSVLLLTYILRDIGYNTKYYNLSNIFNDYFELSPYTNLDLAKNIIKEYINYEQFEENNNDNNNDNIKMIPIITGFFGEVNGGIINSIGRGYTDFTSALVACALNAKSLQVWKESDGIFTGNPTKIKNTTLLSTITPDEANELTYFGNEVLHPYTIKCAINENIPIHILNTLNMNSSGTIIYPPNYHSNDSQIQQQQQKKEDVINRSKHGIIAVCSKKDINILNFSINDLKQLIKVYEIFDKHNIKIDLISSSLTNVSIAIHESVTNLSLNNLIYELNKMPNFSNFNHNDINLKKKS